MRSRSLYEKLYIAGGAMALGGVGMVLSIVLAGAGVVLLALALLVILAGLMVELLAPQLHRLRQALGPPTSHTAVTPER
jgi:hypothetical protein